MRRRRPGCWTRAIILVLASAFASRCLADHERPYVPASDTTVLQQVPATTDPRVRQFDALRNQWQQHPENIDRAVDLSKAYLEYGRGTGDARYLGRAAAVLEPWMRGPSPPLSVLLTHATVIQSRHEFSAATTELGEVLRRDPDNAQAWLTLATISQVRGDMNTARRGCAHLIAGGDPLVAGGCLSSLQTVTGRPRQAYQAMETLIRLAPPTNPALEAWAQGIMADASMCMGDMGLAEAHLRRALELAPGDNFLLADYADLLLEIGRPEAAVQLLRDYTASDTSFLRYVIAEKALHLAQSSADAEQMAARFAANDLRGSALYQREEARFALEVTGDFPSALIEAEKNWQVQRAPADVGLLLRSALAAHRPEAGRAAIEFLQQTHLNDPRVLAAAAQLNRELQHTSDQVGH